MPRKPGNMILRPTHKHPKRPTVTYRRPKKRGRIGRNIRRWWRNRKEKNNPKPNIPHKQIPEMKPKDTEHPDGQDSGIPATQNTGTAPTVPIPSATELPLPQVEVPKPQPPEPDQQPIPEDETRKLEAMTSKPESKLYVSLNRFIDILRRVHRPLWSLTMLAVFLFMFSKGRISDETIVELMKWIVSVYVAGRSFEKASIGISSMIGKGK